MPVPVFTSGEILTAANMNQVGMWLLKTQTIGSGVGSVSVTSVFSSSYDNYRVVFTVNSMNTNGNTISLTLDSTNITASKETPHTMTTPSSPPHHSSHPHPPS